MLQVKLHGDMCKQWWLLPVRNPGLQTGWRHLFLESFFLTRVKKMVPLSPFTKWLKMSWHYILRLSLQISLLTPGSLSSYESHDCSWETYDHPHPFKSKIQPLMVSGTEIFNKICQGNGHVVLFGVISSQTKTIWCVFEKWSQKPQGLFYQTSLA